MVADAGFGNDLDGAAEGAVARGEDRSVVGDGNNFIGATDDMKQGDFGLGEGLEAVDGVAGEGGGFIVGEAVDGEALGPRRGAAVVTRPTLDVAHGGIGVDAGDVGGIGFGPIVDDETAATEAFERDFGGKAVCGGHFAVESVPDVDRGGGAEEVGDITIGDVETALEQSEISLWFVAPKTGAPNPGFARRGLGGCDNVSVAPGDLKIITRVAVPFGAFAGELSESGCGEEAE